MPEALFYHLTAQRLESALPSLLERTLAKGWRATVRLGSAARVDALDGILWTYRDESFLPHGIKGGEAPERQPVYLTDSDEIPNEADVLFVVDGADTDDFEERERTIIMFDGADDQAVAFAREQWVRAADRVKATYWRQGERGGWEKAAESAGS